MNAFVLHDASDRAGLLRWGTSAAAMVAVHAGLIALGLAWYTQRPPPGITMPAIMVDMAPASSAPRPTPMDLAPGPQMQQADASPPPEATAQELVQEQIAPTPPQPKPDIEAPPEQKIPPPPSRPEPAKTVPDRPKPVPAKPRPVRAEAKRPSDTTPAPRTTAPPRAEREAPMAAAMSAGATAATIASYNQLVAAHLQRFKQYPPEAKAAGQQGIARLSFNLGRAGQVLGSRLAGSSGHAALDGETLAMVRRAQPFPAFPPDMKQGSMGFNVPVQFSIR
jgi:periplasmic protein TonB